MPASSARAGIDLCAPILQIRVAELVARTRLSQYPPHHGSFKQWHEPHPPLLKEMRHFCEQQ